MWVAERREVATTSVASPLWHALRFASRPVTATELHLTTAANPRSIEGRLAKWVRAGFVHATNSHPRRYKMSDNAPETAAPPPILRQGTVGKRPITNRQRIWTSMRVLKSFDAQTVAITCELSLKTVKHFIDELRQAGFVAHVRDRRWAGEHATYSLVRRSGPIAPKRSGKSFFDANDGSTYPLVARAKRAASEVNHV